MIYYDLNDFFFFLFRTTELNFTLFKLFNWLNSGMEAILIPGTAHCANMYPPSPQDPPALVAAR